MVLEKLYEAYFDPKERFKPYESDAEYLKEMFGFLDVCFTVICALKGLTGGGLPSPDTVGKVSGLSVSSSDLFSILAPSSEDRVSAAAAEQLESAFAHFEGRTRKSVKNGFVPRFEIVCTKFKLSDPERFAAMISLSVMYDRKYEGVYTYLHNNSSDFLPSYWLIERIYSIIFGTLSGEPIKNARLTDGNLPFLKFIAEPDIEPRKRGVSANRAVMRGCIASYILGGECDETRLAEYIIPRKSASDEKYEKYINIREKTQSRIHSFFMDHAFKDGCTVMNLYGSEGIGRRFTAERAVGSEGFLILVFDMRRILQTGSEKALKLLDMAYIECTLKGAVPCFMYEKENAACTEDDRKPETNLTVLETAAEYITRLFRFVFWLTREKETAFLHTSANFSAVEFPMLTGAERLLFWNAYTDKDDYGDSIDINIISGQYILTPRDIKRIAAAARERAKNDGTKITKDILRESVRLFSPDQLGHFAAPINAVFTWDDLVIDDEQKRKMKMICDQVRFRSIVNEDWGFARKTPYGRGLCALFYGSPGTGKTMAVQVMANDLGLDLYKVDLSQMASKYIGETQKNISELFNRAKNINDMLFFDEADSMFAKRSEVKDSNDRYANADTAFLLQKLEEYEGITVLATNYVNNIDDAFKRRIKFMINFVFPTPDVRLMLWKKILPSAALVDESIDFEFFAEKFELSGSSIKEVLTNAAFLAASEGCGLKNSHIVEAVKLNFSKFGKILSDEDFGYLNGN